MLPCTSWALPGSGQHSSTFFKASAPARLSVPALSDAPFRSAPIHVPDHRKSLEASTHSYSEGHLKPLFFLEKFDFQCQTFQRLNTQTRKLTNLTTRKLRETQGKGTLPLLAEIPASSYPEPTSILAHLLWPTRPNSSHG